MHFALLVATALLVSLRAFQSQNVIHGHYTLAVLTSYIMAFAEVVVVLLVVDTGMSAILWVGTGGAIGVTIAMFAHRKYVQKI